MNTVNLCLWLSGLGVEALLLVLLLRRRLVLRLPVFSILIAFYLLRAGLLYGLRSYLVAEEFGHLAVILSVVDLCLQVLLAIQIAVHAIRARRAGKRFVLLQGTTLCVLATCLAAAVAVAMPERGRIPIDRGLVFVTVLMILLVLGMAVAHLSGQQRRLAEGFALYGVVSILAGVARNAAILHRNRAVFATASYVEPLVYVAIVVFWIVTLRPQSRPELPA